MAVNQFTIGVKIGMGIPQHVIDAVRPSVGCIVQSVTTRNDKGAMIVSVEFIASEEVKKAIFREE